MNAPEVDQTHLRVYCGLVLPYYNWQNPDLDPANPPAPCVTTHNSPNIEAILAWLRSNIGGENWGIYSLRAIRGGTSWSTHAFRAANDWAYDNDDQRLEAIDFLITNHEKLHVDFVADEGHNRIWKSYRTEFDGPGWKEVTITTGGPWVHYETTLNGWADGSSVDSRLLPNPPTSQESPEMISLDWKPNTPQWTALTYTGTHLAHTVNGHADAVMRRAGVVRVTVNDDELLGIIVSSETTTAAPPTLTPAMLAAWSA